MKKKTLAFLTFNAIALTACSYNPFNNFLGIDVVLSIGEGLNVFQNYDYLFWDKNDECVAYDVYLYENTSSSSSLSLKSASSSLKSSLKSSSSSSKAEERPVATTTSCCLEIKNEWVGSEIKIVGYKYENDEGSLFNFKQVTVAESKKIVIADIAPSAVFPIELTINESYLKNQFGSRDYGNITIPKSVSTVSIEGITSNYHPTFSFEAREDNSLVSIVLEDSTLVGKTNYSDASRFRYLGNNKNVDFYFTVQGQNYIEGTGTMVGYGAAIDLPRVVFRYGEFYMNDYPELTVVGGTSTELTVPSGYAIKADRIINYLSPTIVKLIGGTGAEAHNTNDPGDTGQIPIEQKTAVYSIEDHSIGIRAGNGGYSANGKGGNTYTYDYLIGKTYKKYADAFYSLGEPSVGTGENGPGEYIDIEKDSTYRSSRRS